MIERLIIGVVVGILEVMVKRADAQQSAKAEAYRGALEKAREAREFEQTAQHHPDGRTHLRVRDDAPAITIRGDDADSSSDASAS